MTLFTAEKRQFKRERSFKKKRTQLFGNGKDAMSVRNFDDFKRHRYSAVNGTLITTGRTKTAFATKRDKFKVAAVSAAIHGATKRRITAIKHELYEYLYDLDANAQLRTITEFIYSIRKKFKILGLDPIKTIWGIGYKWDIK